jgi:hypothetical protein
VNALKPRLTPAASAALIANVPSNENMATLSEGFQKSFNEVTKYNEDPDKKIVPVVGYTGHRMGYRAQGFFGKNFRDCTIESRNIQKAFAQSSTQNNGNSMSSLGTY